MLNQKKEPALTEAIKTIAPECFGDETQIILNRNVQCKRHVDKTSGYSHVCFFGDFEGGALCFEDGVRFTDKYVWHRLTGRFLTGMRNIRVTNTVSYYTSRGRIVKRWRRLWRASKIRGRIRDKKLNNHNIYH